MLRRASLSPGRRLRFVLSVLAAVLAFSTRGAADPVLPDRLGPADLHRASEWLPGFNRPGVGNPSIGGVTAAVEYRGELVLAGDFLSAGSERVPYVARWDGERLRAFGDGVDGPVDHLAVVGEDLFAALRNRRVVRWDGTEWTTIGRVVGYVSSMLDYRGNLVVGGTFDAIDGVVAYDIARWDGSEWSPIGGPLWFRWEGEWFERGEASRLAVWRDDLYVGGRFDLIGSTPVTNLARWDGTSWQQVLPSPSGAVKGLGVHRDRLIVAGMFRELGDELTRGIASWDGSTWTPLLGRLPTLYDMGPPWTFLSTEEGLLFTCSFDGRFGIALWNGHAWRRLLEVGDIDTVLGCVMAEYRDELVLAGDFEFFRGRRVGGVVVQRGSDWCSLIPGAGLTRVASPGFSSSHAYTMLNSESGLVVAGEFDFAGETPANGVAIWNGADWERLGAGIKGRVHALASYDGNLVAGGTFEEAGGTPARNIARWDGTAWHPLGDSFGDGAIVRALAVFEDDLVAGGNFGYTGSQLVQNVARWDGTSWQPMAAGLLHGVWTLAVYQGELIAGGTFASDGSKPLQRVARWTGSSWESLGGGANAMVGQIVVEGDLLYAIGSFSEVGGVAADRVAVWDGSSWAAVGGEVGGWVSAAAVHGGRLVIASTYSVPGVAESAVRAWNGSSWELAGSCPWGTVNALCSTARGLYVAGDFSEFGGRPAGDIACWDDRLVPTASEPAGPGPGDPPPVLRLDLGFTPRATGGVSILYSVDSPAAATRLAVYDVRGRLVRELEKGDTKPGRYVAIWDGRDARGTRVSRGVYFVDLMAGAARQSAKVVLLGP